MARGGVEELGLLTGRGVVKAEQTAGHRRWAGTIENFCTWKEKVKDSGFMNRVSYAPDPQ
jgi:hypothetical protein